MSCERERERANRQLLLVKVKENNSFIMPKILEDFPDFLLILHVQQPTNINLSKDPLIQI